MRKKLWLLLLLSFMIIIWWCTQTNNQANNNTGDMEIANPASIYCEENGWTLELIFDNWENYGICHFDNWEWCEEQEFYRKECFPAILSGTINKNISSFESCVQAWNPIMESYPRQCKTSDWKIFVEKIGESANTGETNIPACPSDAKICWDGTTVWRTWPDCQFILCPNEQRNATGEEEINNTENKAISDMFKEHKNLDSYDETSLTEDDIDLMNKIIEILPNL